MLKLKKKKDCLLFQLINGTYSLGYPLDRARHPTELNFMIGACHPT